MGEKGKKLTLEQARKMRDGVLKGDSAIAQAWKELIGGPPFSGGDDSPLEEEPAPSSSHETDRWDMVENDSAVKKMDELQRLDEGF